MPNNEEVIRIRAQNDTAAGVKAATAEVHKLGSEVQKISGILKTSLAGILSVGAMKSAATAILDTADALVKMRDKTGIGIEALQYLQAAANGGGNTLEEVTAAISKMQVNLAGGGSDLKSALKLIGLSFDTLRGMKPEDQFAAIGGAIAKVNDPADQAKLRMLLFGKAGNEIAGTLSQNFAQIALDAKVMSEKTAEALDTSGDTLGQWALNIKAVVANSIVGAGQEILKIPTYYAMAFAETEALWDELVAGIYAVAAKGFVLPAAKQKLLAYSKEMTDAANEERLTILALTQQLTAEEAAAGKAGVAVKGAGQAHLDFSKGAGTAKDAVQKLWEEFRKKEIDAYYAALREGHVQHAEFAESVQGAAKQAADAFIAARMKVVDFQNSVKSLAGVVYGLPAVPKSLAGMGETLGKGATDWRTYADKTATSLDAVSRAAEMMGHRTSAAIASIASAMVTQLAVGNYWGAAITGIMGVVSMAIGNGGKQAMTWQEQLQSIAEGNKRILDEQTALLDKYGLSWKNLGADMLNTHWDANLNNLMADIGTLKDYGVSFDAIVASMADELNQLLQDAKDTGKEIPAVLVPFMDRLRELGLLTDATAEATEKRLAEIAATYDKDIETITGKIKTLDDELAALNASEAPEKVMGVVETNERARIESERRVQEMKLAKIQADKMEAIKAEQEKQAAIADGFGNLFTDITDKSALAALIIAQQWKHAPWEDWPAFPGTGGGSTNPPPEPPQGSYAEGTRGLRDFGPGRWARLHNVEAVMTVPQIHNLVALASSMRAPVLPASVLSAGSVTNSRGPTTVHLSVDARGANFTDGRAFEDLWRRLRDKMQGELGVLGYADGAF